VREPVTILEGCAYSVLQTLPSNSVDCLITSPPYWGLRDYGIEPTDWPACFGPEGSAMVTFERITSPTTHEIS